MSHFGILLLLLVPLIIAAPQSKLQRHAQRYPSQLYQPQHYQNDYQPPHYQIDYQPTQAYQPEIYHQPESVRESSHQQTRGLKSGLDPLGSLTSIIKIPFDILKKILPIR